MARPRGRTKTARISVSFEPHVYGALMLLAKRHDVPIAQIIRRAVSQLVAPRALEGGSEGSVGAPSPGIAGGGA